MNEKEKNDILSRIPTTTFTPKIKTVIRNKTTTENRNKRKEKNDKNEKNEKKIERRAERLEYINKEESYSNNTKLFTKSNQNRTTNTTTNTTNTNTITVATPISTLSPPITTMTNDLSFELFQSQSHSLLSSPLLFTQTNRPVIANDHHFDLLQSKDPSLTYENHFNSNFTSNFNSIHEIDHHDKSTLNTIHNENNTYNSYTKNKKKKQLQQQHNKIVGGELDASAYDSSLCTTKINDSVLDGTSFQINKYFGDDSRSEFFERYHYISNKRDVVQRDKHHSTDYQENILTKLITTDPFEPSNLLELSNYPFAPHRHDDNFIHSIDDAASHHSNSPVDFENFTMTDNSNFNNFNSSNFNNSPNNFRNNSIFTTNTITTAGDNYTQDSLSTNAMLRPYDDGLDLSPRSKYINGCLMNELNPRASLILRRKVSTTLNLQHHGMGDKHGVIFAESLKDLPMVHTINLADNNLTDTSLSPIIESIISLPSVTDVDLSQNKIDGQCSIALYSYLNTKHCPLKRLALKSADIDDVEADSFVKSLMNNTTLTELDLSHNSIGRSENLNTVRPEFNTGGETLAQLLQSNTSKLEKLCVSWNMIRLESAFALTTSLAFNTCLRYLDVSYNTLGERAGEALGQSLLTNNTLQTLILSNNSLTASACFCICVGIEENYSLKKVVLDGNPIGESGAKCLTQIPITVGSRVKVSAGGCNLEVRYEKDKLFNQYQPCGSYALNLDDCYHRAIAVKILRILASNPGYVQMLFAYSPHPVPPLETLKPPPIQMLHANPTKSEMMMLQRQAMITMVPPPTSTPIKLKRDLQKFKWDEMDSIKRNTLDGLLNIQSAAKNVTYARELFDEFDRDQSGALDSDELMKLLTTLGIVTDEAEVALAISSCDPENKSQLNWNSFLQFLRYKEDEVSLRIRDMIELPVILDEMTKKKYIPPTTGSLYITITDEYNISSQKILSSQDHSHMVEFVKSGIENVSKALKYSIANTRIREKEALELHELMNSEIKNAVTVGEILLPHIADPHEARSYIYKIFGYDRESIKRLEFNLGNALRPILGLYDGYYYLDLSIPSDRTCLKKLLEQSQLNKEKCIKNSLFQPGLTGDLSQHGDWSSFRNSFVNGTQTYIRTELFSPIPETGTVSFDFIGSDRPPRGASIIPDTRCINIMFNANLITQEEKFGIQIILNQMKQKSKESFQFNGNFDKLYTRQKAEDIQLVMLVFYQMLAKRTKYYKHTRKLESETGGLVKYQQNKTQKEELKKKAKNKSNSIFSNDSSDSDSTSSDDDSEIDIPAEAPMNKFKKTNQTTTTTTGGGNSAVEDSISKNLSIGDHEMDSNTRKIVGRRFSQLRRQSAHVGDLSIPAAVNTKLNSSTSLTPISEMTSSHSKTTSSSSSSTSLQPNTQPTALRQRKLAVFSTKQEYIYDLNSKMTSINEANVNKYVKCHRIVESLYDVISRLWIRCRHLAVIIQYFNSGRIDKVKYFGTYRVELIIQVYSRIVDLHNFDLILDILSAFEIGCLTCRIGILHYFNPLKLEGSHCLDLSKRDERVAAKILAYLSTIEPGKNWIDPTFRWAFQLPCIPGWMLTQSWLDDSTMPFRGILTVEYYSGGGTGLLGCNPIPSVRKSLLPLVSIHEMDVIEDEHNKLPQKGMLHLPNTGIEAAISRQDGWMRLLCPRDSTSAKIANGEDVLSTLLEEQNRLHLAYRVVQEVDSDEESEVKGQKLATIAKAKSLASKILDRQRSKITEVKRPQTAPSGQRRDSTVGIGATSNVNTNSNSNTRSSMINSRRNSKLMNK